MVPMEPRRSRCNFYLPSLPGGVPGPSSFRCQRRNIAIVAGSSFLGETFVGNPNRSPNTTLHITPPSSPRGQKSASHMGRQLNSQLGTSQNNPRSNQNFVSSHVAMASTSQSPFLAALNLPDLTKLTNDRIAHDPNWPPMPTKLPSDIPNFEGKQAEDPGNHIMTFHLWCSSNSIIDDTIRLRPFQCTLMGVAAKWYVEQPPASHGTFSTLANVFLT